MTRPYYQINKWRCCVVLFLSVTTVWSWPAEAAHTYNVIEAKQEQSEDGAPQEQEISEEAEPELPKPPEGILPIQELTTVSYSSNDHPALLMHETILFVSSRSGLVEAHDASTGESIWKLGLPGKALHKPLVYSPQKANSAETTAFSLLLSDSFGHIILLNGLTGEIQRELQLPFRLAIPPILGPEGILYLANYQGQITSYNVETETIIFQTETSERPNALAIAPSRLVVSGSHYRVFAINTVTGLIEWTFIGRSAFHAAATFNENASRLYIGDDVGNFYSLDAKTGRIKFHWATGASIKSSALVDEKRVYLASFANTLFAFNGGNGHELWRANLPGRPITTPIRINNRLLVSTFDGILVEVDPIRGRLIERYVAPGEISEAPQLFIKEMSPEEKEQAASLASERNETIDPTEPSTTQEIEPFTPTAFTLETDQDSTSTNITSSSESDSSPHSEQRVLTWFEQSRIAIRLRSGEVMLLRYASQTINSDEITDSDTESDILETPEDTTTPLGIQRAPRANTYRKRKF